MARTTESAGSVTRRGFIGMLSGAAAALGLGGLSAACGGGPIGKRTATGPEGRTSFITQNDDFYLVAVNTRFRPDFGPENVERHWSLEVRGLGSASRRHAYGELRNMDSAEFLYTFECIGNEVGGDLIGNARWRGVPLRAVLEPVLPDSRAGYTVMFRGLDDFYSSVSIERCLSPDSFIAYEMNGEPLPPGHGFPARVILPDLYGMKQPRWLDRIELLESPEATGFWDEEGWASEVPVKAMSRLDTPPARMIVEGDPYRLTGVGFAGARGIERVEVSLDGGATWEGCRLVEGGAAGVWALWAYDWEAPTVGEHELLCRVTDGTGRVQTSRRQGPYPDGASGYHRATIGVRPRSEAQS